MIKKLAKWILRKELKMFENINSKIIRKAKTWYVDCNEFSPMINGSQIVIRDEGTNGEGTKLMLIGLGEVNEDLPRLTHEQAYLIASAPVLLEALQNIQNDNNNIPSIVWNMRNDAIACALGEKHDY